MVANSVSKYHPYHLSSPAGSLVQADWRYRRWSRVRGAALSERWWIAAGGAGKVWLASVVAEVSLLSRLFRSLLDHGMELAVRVCDQLDSI